MSRVLDMQIVMPRADALRWVYSLFFASLAVFTGFFCNGSRMAFFLVRSFIISEISSFA